MDGYEATVKYWQSKTIDSGAALSEALNSHGITYAFHSGNLENAQITYHDTREIFEHDGVVAYTGDLRTLFEIRNAKAAYEYMINAFDGGEPLDESMILEYHRLLTQNTYDSRRWQLGERPGTYKLHDYITGPNEVGAAPEDVADEMAELLEELETIEDHQVLTAAAYFHVKFENIHPFADGNGRVGRLAMNYLLLSHHHPMIIIHQEDRLDYYGALEAWDREQDLKPMITFLKEQTVKSWEKQVCRSKAVLSMTKEQFDMEMQKGLDDIQADRTVSIGAVEEEMRRL